MRLTWICMLAALLATPMTGCGPKEEEPQGDPIAREEDDHGHATDLPGAVKELKQFRDQISDGFKEDDEAKAHGPLHEVGHVLEGMLDHMDDMTADLSEESKATVEEATKKAFDLFMKVDAKLHGQEGADYSEVSDEIDAEIAKLEAVLEGTPAEPAKDPADEPAKEPADEPAKEPADEPAKEPAE